MISYENIENREWKTEGFECSLSGDVVSFGAGTVTFPSESYTFESFDFLIEGDPDIPVQYDVFLLRNNEVDVMRTELGLDTVAFYDGEEALLHCLMSVVITPGAESSSLSLAVRNVVLQELSEE